MNGLRKKLTGLAEQWIQGLPSHQELRNFAAEMEKYKRRVGIAGLWKIPPVMVTATIDDGLGQGIEIIRTWASVSGIRVIHLGLLQSAEKIIAACDRQKPDLFGTTVLQLDSEPVLAAIGKGIPPNTRFIAGGPVFRFDPEMARRCGIDKVIGDLAHFLTFVLKEL